MDDNAKKLLAMFIKDGYSVSGRISKRTALEMMKFVGDNKELQRAVNIGDWKALPEAMANL